MSSHCARLLAVVFVFATLSSYGCESGNGTGWQEERFGGIRPSQIGFNGIAEPTTNTTNYYAHGVTLQSPVVIPQIAPMAACPTRSFSAPVRIVVVGDDSDVFLNQVDARFVDRKGVSRETTLTRDDLTDVFGSTLVPRFGTRVFPLTLPFGCTADVNGTLAIAVFTGNAFGAINRTPFSVVVR